MKRRNTMDRNVMERIYQQLQTPYKYGSVMKLDGRMTDSPVVFKKDGKYYMSFISIDDECRTGYLTHIAESRDLLHWDVLGEILKESHNSPGARLDSRLVCPCR